MMTQSVRRKNERGAALAMAVIIIAILAVIALTALAFSSTEARIAGSDLQRTRTFYATVSAMEKMTNDFSDLFRSKMRPSVEDLNKIAAEPPDALIQEGFKFEQKLEEDTEKLQELQAMQKLPANIYPRVNIPEGPFVGLYANVIPYKITSTGSFSRTSAQVKLEREFNNYLIPLFQFGIFSNEDVEFHPGPWMTFNGRIHSNQNIYALRNIKFLNRMTMAGELVRDASRGGETNNASGWNNVWIEANGRNVQITKGSVQAGSGTVGGPNLLGSKQGTRGYYPNSPAGIPNSNWESTSVKTATGAANQFGGQILTNSTGATQLKMPLELEGNSPVEIIKRSLPTDSEMLGASRYQSKAKVRILLDDETAGSGSSNAAGIPAGKGVNLSTFTPVEMNGGKALRRVSDAGAYLDPAVVQKRPDGKTEEAKTVRGIRKVSNQKTANGSYVPPGANIKGRILIEIIKPDGTEVDVTEEILSMGMTQGEPNGIVYLQRPLWAAFVQGSRDRNGKNFDLTYLIKNTQHIADGEIVDPLSNASFMDSKGAISLPADAWTDAKEVGSGGGGGSGDDDDDDDGGLLCILGSLLINCDSSDGSTVAREATPQGGL